MPVFYQHVIDENSRLGIWKIEESEQFFLNNVPIQPEVSHPHKRLQHLAGRFLLRFLFPGFPYELIRIADTNKPFLSNEEYHFSISHCGDYAAAIVSRTKRVGIDIEIPSPRIERIKHKFLNEKEVSQLAMGNEQWAIGNEQLAMGNRQWAMGNVEKMRDHNPELIALQELTLLWSAKEAVFKWYGDGGVDFSDHIQLRSTDYNQQSIDCYFSKNNSRLLINYQFFEHLVLAWVTT